MPELTRNSSYTRRLRTLTGLAGVVALIGGVLLVSAIPVRTGVATIPAPAVGVIIGDRVQAVLPMTPAPLVDLTGHELPPTDGSREFSQVVERGDTLAEILVPHGVTQGEIEALFAAGQEGKALQRLRAGQVLAAHLDRDGRVLSLRHEADHLSAVVIERGASGFNSRREPVALERRTERASGVIDSTLFDAAEEAGLSDSLTMALADIFGYDIDFALDLRDEGPNLGGLGSAPTPLMYLSAAIAF